MRGKTCEGKSFEIGNYSGERQLFGCSCLNAKHCKLLLIDMSNLSNFQFCELTNRWWNVQLGLSRLAIGQSVSSLGQLAVVHIVPDI